MPTARCAFCGHDNPAASNFCNECGAALHLTLCAQCEAVNDRKATQCHKCGAPLTTPLRAEADLCDGGNGVPSRVGRSAGIQLAQTFMATGRGHWFVAGGYRLRRDVQHQAHGGFDTACSTSERRER